MSVWIEADHPVVQPAPQLRYAAVLEWGTRLGLVLLAASFLAYVAGWLPGQVDPRELPRFWSQPVAQFMAQTGSPAGWRWLGLLQHGDMLGLAGIALLAGSSGVALVALVPAYLAQHDRLFAGLSLLQLAVLLGAASGAFT